MELVRNEYGLALQLKEGKLEIRVIDESIIRVIYYLHGNVPETEEMIVNYTSKPFSAWEYCETADGVQVTTKKVLAEFSYATESITLYDSNKETVILQEKPIDSRKITKNANQEEEVHSVEQVFVSPDSEVICGLGQQQDQAMNYKGRFVHLNQYNIINAVPFMISNQGYGILWNNSSLTEVNRDKELFPMRFNPYTKTWSETFIPDEDGEYVFIIEKLNKNNGLEKVEVTIDDKPIIYRETLWHPNYYSGTMQMEKGKSYEILANCTVHLYFQRPSMKACTSMWSEVANCIDYYLIYGPEADSIVGGYRKLTGQVPMFGKWAFGFWQSKETYETAEELLAVVNEYRKKNHPLDNIVQDWNYWRGYGWNALTVSPEYTNDMASMIKKLHELNVHFMITIWPNFDDNKYNNPYKDFKEEDFCWMTRC